MHPALKPARPGMLVRSTVALGRRVQHVDLPVWRATGTQPGPTFFLSAGMHGDEVNAVTILQRFVRQLDLTQLHGSLIIVPVANVSGFHARTRCVPEDGRDLNRTFPGKASGTISERIAHFILTELVAEAQWGLDIHDAGTSSVLLPHARVLDPRALEFGAAFGTEIVMRCTLPPGYGGQLTVEARRRYDIPFFHVELGGEPIRWTDVIEQGVTGVRNLLIYRGMLPGQRILPRVQYFLPGRDDLAVLSPLDGLLTLHVTLGQAVVRTQPLATIENPFTQKKHTMRADAPGFVLAVNVRALVQAGEDVVGVIKLGPARRRSDSSRLRLVQRRVNRPTASVIVRPNRDCRRSNWLVTGCDRAAEPSRSPGQVRV